MNIYRVLHTGTHFFNFSPYFVGNVFRKIILQGSILLKHNVRKWNFNSWTDVLRSQETSSCPVILSFLPTSTYDGTETTNTLYRPKTRLQVLRAGFMFSWPTIIKHNINSDTHPTEAPTVLDTADGVFEMGRYEECYNILINSKNPEDIEVKWRLCRVLYNMAKDSKYDEQYRRDIISQAYKIIAPELERNWDNFAVHKWYALTLDAKSTIEGIKEKIKHLENVKKHMDLAVTLNPNDASLLHILGEWCFQITELPWHQRKTVEALFATLPYSTYEDALEYFLRAEAAQPRFYSINLLRIGCCYLKLDKGDQAKYYLKLAASYPAKSNDDHRANKEAAELLKQIKYIF